VSDHEPTTPFWMTVVIGDLSGMAESTLEAHPWHESEDEALAHARDDANGGLPVFVYLCTPMYRVSRGAVRITKLDEQKRKGKP